MHHELAHIAILVNDYDEAIAFYTGKLKFRLVEDTPLSETKRWVLIRPEGSQGCCLLLAKAINEEQKRAVGNQSGGRVFLFLHTDNLKRDHQDLVQQGVVFTREPTFEKWGAVAVFKDLYGNLWDLIEPNHQ